MSYLSKVIPLVRARSSSPIVFNPIIGSRIPTLRSISPLTSIISSGSDHGSLGGSRGYATAFAGLPTGFITTNATTGTVSGWGSKAPMVRSMSDVSMPEAPTSNHPHKPIPGATGKLIYTET